MREAVDERPLLLVYRALGLGDLLTAVPALRALASAHPDHRRVLCCPEVLAPLALLSGSVEEVAHTAPLAPPPARLREADVAVNLHGSGPQSHRAILEAAPERLIAFACPAANVAGPPWREDEHEVVRWCRLLSESGIAADPRRIDLPRPPWPAPGALRGCTVIHPGAASGARRWPAERWAQVARHETASGARVVITGSADEAGIAHRVAALAGLDDTAVLAGRTGVGELAAIVAGAGRVVCGDTGVAHLATAFATPSVVIFGPTPPALWGPPADRLQHVVLWAGRTGDPHATEPGPGLMEIAADDVTAALDELARPSPAV